MKVTVEFGRELDQAVQNHLEGGAAVRVYIRAAVAYFNYMITREQEGKAVGFGDKTRFASYNTVVSAAQYLREMASE